jgi:16S rRNA (cytidine1402-2'-O)-methyltransferase
VRAVETLQAVDLILCEDTRHSAGLLSHYEIEKPTASYGSHNLKEKVPWIVGQLQAGKKIAYISDAGTPGISDPGTVLVRAVIDAGLHVSAVPGPSAFILALSISGLPTDRFVFEAFLPHKKGRQTRLRELAEEERTIILYESPHRIIKTLAELLEHLGDRQAVCCRELTKFFEEVNRGTLSQILTHYEEKNPRGEFVLIVAGSGFDRPTPSFAENHP